MIKEVTNNKEWESFIKKCNKNTFLQSLGWVLFNENRGYKVWKLGSYKKDVLKSAVFVFKISAKRGTFLFVPHGPIFEKITKLELQMWVDYLRLLAIKESCSFVRISPIEENTDYNNLLFKNSGFKKSPIHMHAEDTTVLDLTPTIDEVMMKMRKTTRQMCKKGQQMVEKKEVEIEEVSEITDEMYKVYLETTQRGGFVGFSKKYIQQEYDCFNNSFDTAHYRVIRYEGVILSWGLFIFSGKRAFYHQGANILHKKVPASYLCHFTGIQLAKEYGCESYDFWGVSPLGIENHPWKNISLFKRGFGGQDISLVPAQDLPISLKYYGTWLIEKIRAKRRGF
jgi:peptidoglycan pentaglycine glycine transferase (the first glycine)